MKRALFILILVVGIVIGWVLIPAAPKPIWQTNAQLTFLGFTNTVSGLPATNAWFGLSGVRISPRSWEVLEVAHKEGGRWKRWEPLPDHSPIFHRGFTSGFLMSVSIPVPTTNAPLRVVVEIGENGPGFRKHPTSAVGKFYELRRYRFMQWIYPNNPARWLPRAPLHRMTNEFNFGVGTNSVRR